MRQPVMIGKSYVGAWEDRWTERSTSEPFAFASKAYHDAMAVARSIGDQAAAIKSDRNLSDRGRQNSLSTLVEKDVLPKLASTGESLARARAWVDRKRSTLGPAKPDKTDLAGAILRQEARQHLKSMDPVERIALLTVGDIDPVTALAIVEGEPWMSGVTAEQRARVVERAVLAAHPEVAAELADIAEAVDVAEGAIRAATKSVTAATGIDVSSLGAQGLKEFIAGLFEGEVAE